MVGGYGESCDFVQCFGDDCLLAVVDQQNLAFFKSIVAAVRGLGLTWLGNGFRWFPMTSGSEQVANADLVFASLDGLRLPFVPHERHDFPQKCGIRAACAMAFADEHVERIVVTRKIKGSFRVDGDVIGVAEEVVWFACADGQIEPHGARLAFTDEHHWLFAAAHGAKRRTAEESSAEEVVTEPEGVPCAHAAGGTTCEEMHVRIGGDFDFCKISGFLNHLFHDKIDEFRTVFIKFLRAHVAVGAAGQRGVERAWIDEQDESARHDAVVDKRVEQRRDLVGVVFEHDIDSGVCGVRLVRNINTVGDAGSDFIFLSDADICHRFSDLLLLRRLGGQHE